MYKTIPQIFTEITSRYPAYTVQMSKDKHGVFVPTTYSELLSEADSLAASLSKLGVKRGDPVGLISDNRHEWLASDLAILSLGASDVPRGRDAMPYEIQFILNVTESRFCFVENAVQLRKVLNITDKLPNLKHLIVMDGEGVSDEGKGSGLEIHFYTNLVEEGRVLLNDQKVASYIRREREAGTIDEIATIIFTSGTTGDPKGVMLTHRNFAYQLEAVPKLIKKFAPGQRWLSVLPVWHSFERILQYMIISNASTIAYSKPLGSVLLADLQAVNPHWMGSVPRIWEAVRAGVYASLKNKSPIQRGLFNYFVGVASRYGRFKDMLLGEVPTFNKRSRVLDIAVSLLPTLLLAPMYKLGDKLVFSKVKQKLGKNFIAGVSGGGSLSESVDYFFSSIGVKLLDGYGLTESAPVVAVRPLHHGVKRTMKALEGTQVKIVDENGLEVTPGQKGVVMVKGPQVMKGYFKRPDLTSRVLSEDGWLNTGDLGMWTHKGEFAICGRAKDTIVLSGGENLEPVPIEAKLCESEFIESAVVIGQDQRYLGALIVPNLKKIEEYLAQKHIPLKEGALTAMDEVRSLLERTVANLISSKHGFKPFEHIAKLKILEKSFEVGKELSAKQELKRFEIYRLYEREINDLFAS